MCIWPCRTQTLWLQNISQLLYISQRPCVMWYPVFFSTSFSASDYNLPSLINSFQFPFTHHSTSLHCVFAHIAPWALQSFLQPLIISVLFTREILSIKILQPGPHSSSMVWLIFLYVPIIFYSLPQGIRIYAKYVLHSQVKTLRGLAMFYCSFCTQFLLHSQAHSRTSTCLLNGMRKWIN